MKKRFNWLTATLIFALPFTASAVGIDPGISTVTPLCISNDTQSKLPLIDETAVRPLEFVPLGYFNYRPRYGYDVIPITQETYDRWYAHCEENQILVAHMKDYGENSYMPFKTEKRIYREIFVKDLFKNRANTILISSQARAFRTFDRIYTYLTSIAALNDLHENVVSYLKNTKNLTVNLILGNRSVPDNIGEAQILVAMNCLNHSYKAENNLVGKFTLERLVTHQLVHAALPPETEESDIITTTNEILETLGYQDLPRETVPSSPVESEDIDT